MRLIKGEAAQTRSSPLHRLDVCLFRKFALLSTLLMVHVSKARQHHRRLQADQSVIIGAWPPSFKSPQNPSSEHPGVIKSRISFNLYSLTAAG